METNAQPASELRNEGEKKCVLTGKPVLPTDIVPIAAIRSNLVAFIKIHHPEFNDHSIVSHKGLLAYRKLYLEQIIENEIGDSDKVEKEVINAITNQELLAGAIIDEGPALTFGESLADNVAKFGGSWRFIIAFSVVIFLWIFLNATQLLFHSFDPYPYILLNLLLSCVAAMQAPLIMMSQNRQDATDRMRSDYDYKVNLKAELEIRLLHEKIDHLMIAQMQKMMESQQLQMDCMEELTAKVDAHIKLTTKVAP